MENAPQDESLVEVIETVKDLIKKTDEKTNSISQNSHKISSSF
jgi:hypothetical protein